MTLRQAFTAFLIEQQIRGNSPKTIRYYENSVGQFISSLNTETGLNLITIQNLRDYYLSLTKRNLSSTTIQSYIRALRAFFRWCYDEEYIDINLAEKFRLPKAKQKTIDILTDNEIHSLMLSFNLNYIIHLRNYCICSLMLDSGLRMGEVISLTMERLHIDEGYAIVDGKGNKQRIIPLGLHSRKMLLRYINRRPACLKHDYVFVTSAFNPISENTIRLMFKRLKIKLNIPRIRAHLLRHTFATKYLENGGDMYSLQQILGHTSLEMVRRYVHITTRKLVPAYSKYSPLDNLMK